MPTKRPGLRAAEEGVGAIGDVECEQEPPGPTVEGGSAEEQDDQDRRRQQEGEVHPNHVGGNGEPAAAEQRGQAEHQREDEDVRAGGVRGDDAAPAAPPADEADRLVRQRRAHGDHGGADGLVGEPYPPGDLDRTQDDELGTAGDHRQAEEKHLE